MRFSICAALLATACAIPAYGQITDTTDANNVSIGSPIALTFYVAPKYSQAAEAKAKSIQTPGSADYHKFLSVSQWVQDYAVSDMELRSIEGSLENLGFRIGYVYPNHLAIEVLGTVGVAQAALSVQIKHVTVNGRTGFAPNAPVKLPAELQGKIRAVGGLDTIPRARPMHVVPAFGKKSVGRRVANGLVGGTPGNYLPADFVNFYGVKPVYDQGYTGRGSTIGIVTLNTFNAADAYTFWSAIGLKVSQSRITKVDVDGGIEAATNNAGGEGETDLDTEYSGALAPEAKLRVYIAPIATNYGFENGFEAAASENIADTVSSSWGQPELDYFYDVATRTPGDTALLQVYHDVFLEMALQGQTLYIAAGDSGSFDTVRDICPAFGTPGPTTPVCNAPFTVDSPGNDPLVTAAGGTTLPFSFDLTDGTVLSVPKERAWGWDYIASEAAAQGHGSDIPLSAVFSVGGGGGVSSYWGKPWYQNYVPGITLTQPAQYLSFDYGMGSNIAYILPSSFAGRNMPDISTNADPESGYQYVEGGFAYNFNGGTSFVAPQLNGVTALFVEALHGRVGQINPALYKLGQKSDRDTTLGDNWGYAAAKGYDNASGVGTLDAATLLTGLQTLKAAK